jgi:hypothetical protein
VIINDTEPKQTECANQHSEIGLTFGYRARVVCTFCDRPAADKWALTACNGDPADVESWRREILPACPRCNRLLEDAGSDGLKLKRTGERWFGGHTVGRFKAAGMPGHRDT